MASQEKKGFAGAFAAGAAGVVLLVAVLYALTRYAGFSIGTPEARLPFGPAEEAYAKNLRFENPERSRAANLLNQEITFVSGTVLNAGRRGVRNIEVAVEFRDVFGQVVLRDTRRLWGAPAGTLRPGERRGFQLSYEHVPADWNQAYPSLRVTGLLLD